MEAGLVVVAGVWVCESVSAAAVTVVSGIELSASGEAVIVVEATVEAVLDDAVVWAIVDTE